MATCSKCFDKATKKNESVTWGEINSSVEGEWRRRSYLSQGLKGGQCMRMHIPKWKTAMSTKDWKEGNRTTYGMLQKSQETDCSWCLEVHLELQWKTNFEIFLGQNKERHE